nr:hypothetical protein [Tanacetum cinerariifolium]
MRELREDTFSENKNDDAHEHVERVLDITDFPQGPSILRISLRRLLSEGTVRHPRPLSSLKTSVTSSKKATKHYTMHGKGRTNGGKFEECKAILTEDGLPLYTPFYYYPEEIEYLLAHLGFLDNERQENDKSGMKEALAAL